MESTKVNRYRAKVDVLAPMFAEFDFESNIEDPEEMDKYLDGLVREHIGRLTWEVDVEAISEDEDTNDLKVTVSYFEIV